MAKKKSSPVLGKIKNIATGVYGRIKKKKLVLEATQSNMVEIRV